MGLFSFFSGRTSQKALTGTQPVVEALNNRSWNPYPALGGTNLLARDRINSVYVACQSASYGWIYEQQPSVRKVIEYLAGQVAQLGGPKLYERVSDDDRRHVPDHAAAECLRRPNDWTPGKKFIRAFVTDFLVYGNSYALKYRNVRGGPLTLMRVSPAMVGVVGQNHFAIEAYRIWTTSGEHFDVAPTDMIHWRGENTADPRMGSSKLETAREEIAADAAARQANTELHRSGLAAAGFIYRPMDAPEISSEGLKRLRESLSNQAKNSRREYPILDEGMTFQPGNVTPEDAELIAARTWTSELIASLYGLKHVPPEGDEERNHLIMDVLPDICGQLTDFLGLQLLDAEYGLPDFYFEFDLDSKMMGNDRLKALTSAAGRPIFTVNEARAAVNLPAKKGGDELVVPMNVERGGKPSIDVMPIQDPNKPSQDGDHRSGDADKPMAAGSRASLNGNGHKAVPGLLPRRVTKDRNRNEFASDLESTIKGFHDHFQRSVKSRKLDIKAVADEERWEARLGDEMLKPTRRGVALIGGIEAARIGLDEFDLGQVENYLKEATAGKAKQIVQALRLALRDGDPAEVLTQAKDVEAPRAAMTFATAMAGFAVKEAGAQAPDRDFRTVTVYGGECEVCAPHQGAQGLSDMSEWPPYHPSCGCLAEVDGGGPPVVKAVPVETKQQPVVIHNHVAPPNVGINVSEGALQFKAGDVTIDPPPPAQITLPDVDVHPAELNFAEGAFTSHTVVEAAKPADVQFAKGAFHIENPVTVEAAAPADIRFVEGAIQSNVNVEQPQVNVEAPAPADIRFVEGAIQSHVNVEQPNVNVEAPQAPDLHVTVEPPAKTTKRVIRDKDGRIKEIVEEGRKQTVTRDDTNRIQSIEEE